ncbi:unnamed protein product, partial [Owenia fusiformis]
MWMNIARPRTVMIPTSIFTWPRRFSSITYKGHTQHVLSLCCALIWVLCTSQNKVLAAQTKTCNHATYAAGAKGYYCGDKLRMILDLLCHPNGFYDGRGKRDIEIDDDLIDLSKQNPRMKNVFIEKDEASSYLKKRDAGMRGITCECCMNPCGVPELTQYCKSGKRSGYMTLNNRKRSRHSSDGITSQDHSDSLQTSNRHRNNKHTRQRHLHRFGQST